MRIEKGLHLLAAAALLAVTSVPQAAEAKQSAKSKKPAVAALNKQAGKNTRRANRKAAPAPVENSAELVVDADSGRVIHEKNAGAIRYPASLTKMMTLYLTFDALKKGKMRLDTSLPVSAKAAGQPATNIALKTGDRLPVRAAIESVVVRSANDSAMVLGEALGGTEFNFALMMTQKARELGMKNTIFRNPSGLPDDKQHTTAFDMARLGIALKRDFPQYYPYFKLTSFSYKGVTYPGHNHVMERYAGVDGLKTGYIRASGYNLVTSAHRGGYNLVAVVLGGSTISSRDNAMIGLLDRTFAQLGTRPKNVAQRQNSGQQPPPKPQGEVQQAMSASRNG